MRACAKSWPASSTNVTLARRIGLSDELLLCRSAACLSLIALGPANASADRTGN
jgi:hypothetical protein